MAWVVPLLSRCDGCGFKFDVNAPNCPECGEPRDGMRPRLLGLFGGDRRRKPAPFVGRRPDSPEA